MAPITMFQQCCSGAAQRSDDDDDGTLCGHDKNESLNWRTGQCRFSSTFSINNGDIDDGRISPFMLEG